MYIAGLIDRSGLGRGACAVEDLGGPRLGTVVHMYQGRLLEYIGPILVNPNRLLQRVLCLDQSSMLTI